MDSSSLDPSRHAQAEPSWDDLKIFLAVVAHGSMNGAGRALGQSQPTIARRIRILEECLGVDLFQRGPNSLILTEAGRAVLEVASPMAEAARSIPKLAAAYRPDPEAPVRLTATMSVTMFLSHHAAGLARATAPTEIAYIPMRRKADLAAAEADIALRLRRMPEEEDLIVRKIGRIAFAIYARTPDVAAVIVPPEDPNLSRQAAFIAHYANGRPIAARIGDVPIRYQATKAGLGAAVLPCWLGDADPDLVRVADPTDEMVEDIFLVTHRRGRNRESVAQVSAALVDLFRRERHALAGTRQAD